jgi:hypothetical protein
MDGGHGQQNSWRQQWLLGTDLRTGCKNMEEEAEVSDSVHVTLPSCGKHLC